MSERHTAGPWFADVNRSYGFPIALTPNIPINPMVLGRPINVSVAKVSRDGGQEAIANAHLIAAAPEMLAALRRAALALAFAAESSDAMRDDYEAVRAAIVKATGATS